MAFVMSMVPVAPIRKEAAHRSEMVSQLLFGELAEVIESSGVHTKIRCVYDNYEGWCQTSQLTVIDVSQFDQDNKLLSVEWTNTVELDGSALHISLGTSL